MSDFVSIPFHRDFTGFFITLIKMYKPKLLFRTNKHDFIMEVVSWATLGKNQEHIFKRKTVLKEKYQPQNVLPKLALF